MQKVISTPVIALADGLSLPVIVVAVLVIVVVAVLVLRRRTLPPGETKEALPPGDSSPAADTSRPTKDPLAERKVVDGPVEITEGMSLKEIREAKRARLTDKYKATEGLAEKERRKGRSTEKTTLEQGEETPVDAGEPAENVPGDDANEGTSADGEVPASPSLDSGAASSAAETVSKFSASPARSWGAGDDDDGGWDDVAEAVEVALSGAHPAVPEDTDAASGSPAPGVEAEEESAGDDGLEAGDEPAALAAGAEAEAPVEGSGTKAEEGASPPESGESGPGAREGAAADSPSDAGEGEAAVEAADSTSDAGDADTPARVPVDMEATKSLREGLGRTRGGFVSRLGDLFRSRPAVDEGLLEEVEEVLFTADIGSRTGQRLLEVVTEQIESGVGSEEIWGVIRQEALRILKDDGAGFVVPEGEGPFVVLVVGVNGAGKTTTIGKLAARLRASGKSVLMVAGDTFRAAAVEQLREWSERVGCGFHAGAEGADPSGVVFDGIRKAVEEGADVVLCDTAGRLHTKQPLIDELKKVTRVCGKALDGAPHETLLVLDANTGQNAIQQARLFGEAADVSGIVLTKLDGTAKGGVVLGIRQELGVPVYFIGIGEAVGDLRPFDASEFVDALF